MPEPVFIELKAIISDFKAKMLAARGEMSATEAHASSKFQAIGKASGIALAGVAGAAIGIGVQAVKMGADLQEANRKLKVAVEDTGASFDKFKGPIANADKAMEKFGFTNVETEEALSVGVTATNSTSKALQYLQVAADLARYKHLSLADAMTLVVKGAEGQLRPLRALGIDLPVVAGNAAQVASAQHKLAAAEDVARAAHQKFVDAQGAVNAILKQFPDAANPASKAHHRYEQAVKAAKTADDHFKTAQNKVEAAQQTLNARLGSGKTMLETLAGRLKGQAADSSETFSGKVVVLKARLQDVGAKIGLFLIPWIERLAGKVSSIIDWFHRHADAAKALAGVITVVLGGALAAFTINKIAQFIGGINKAIGALGNLAGKSKATATKVEADQAAMGSGATNFGSKLSAGLGIAAAGVAAFQTTSQLLKSNFLGIGDAVNGAARAISNFFGGVGQVKPSASFSPEMIHFLEELASGTVTARNISAADAQQWLHEAHVPGYAIGGYVRTTGLAMLHAGETVVPASPATGFGGGDLVVQLGAQEFVRVAGPMLRTWLLEQPGRTNTRGKLKT